MPCLLSYLYALEWRRRRRRRFAGRPTWVFDATQQVQGARLQRYQRRSANSRICDGNMWKCVFLIRIMYIYNKLNWLNLMVIGRLFEKTCVICTCIVLFIANIAKWNCDPLHFRNRPIVSNRVALRASFCTIWITLASNAHTNRGGKIVLNCEVYTIFQGFFFFHFPYKPFTMCQHSQTIIIDLNLTLLFRPNSSSSSAFYTNCIMCFIILCFR